MMHTLALALALAAAASSAAVTKRDAFDGQATYFYQGGNAGSCGDVHADSDYIVAMSSDAYGYNAKCGATVTITNTGGGDQNNGVGTTIQALVADSCMIDDNTPCPASQLDLSTGAFMALTGGNLDPPGEFNIHWTV